MVNTGNITDANFLALEQDLKKLGVPKNYYSLGRERNERTCIIEEDNEWIVFYFEKGSREDLHRFFNFSDMKKYVLDELSN